jgi:hypothetical protein
LQLHRSRGGHDFRHRADEGAVGSPTENDVSAERRLTFESCSVCGPGFDSLNSTRIFPAPEFRLLS